LEASLPVQYDGGYPLIRDGQTDRSRQPLAAGRLTNGGGVGVLATDRLVDLGGEVADLSADTLARLDAVLPPTWSKVNPVDIIGDADAERYACALDALLADPNNDAILVMNVPTALASPAATAARVAEVIRARHEDKMNLKPQDGILEG
jgi:acetyltransferase